MPPLTQSPDPAQNFNFVTQSFRLPSVSFQTLYPVLQMQLSLLLFLYIRSSCFLSLHHPCLNVTDLDPSAYEKTQFDSVWFLNLLVRFLCSSHIIACTVFYWNIMTLWMLTFSCYLSPTNYYCPAMYVCSVLTAKFYFLGVGSFIL